MEQSTRTNKYRNERQKVEPVSKTPMDIGAAKMVPESLSAEAAVLGSMIVDPECIGEVIEYLGASATGAFYRIENQMIFDCMVHLYEQNKGQGIDAVLLRDELTKRKQLEAVGNVEYIGKVVESVPSSANVIYYTKIIKDKQLLRELIAAASEILDSAHDVTGETDEKLDSAEQKIFAITNKKITGASTAIRDLVIQAYEMIERRQGSHVTGLATGFFELDELTCGLQNGEMIIIAGRPSMGKTSLALNVAEHIAVIEQRPVAIFSLEMGKQQLAERFLCSNSEIDSQLVRKGMLSTEHYQQLVKSCGILSESPIFIDDSAGITPLELRAKARRLKARYDIKCILIDYLQLMSLGVGRIESRQQEITTISRYIKAMARELDIPVVVLSQLNRSPEGREGHRPRMSDLRESGSIEQDADVVMLLHREDYYHRGQDDYQETNSAEVIIAKQRNGPTGNVQLSFMEKYTRFKNLSHAEEPF
ncbi:MAG: replicative DNA helicase [Sedimentisphaerales bacterium]|nr:replicative DNA helicase [Sedimentisphaerales bacterium]